MWAALAQNTITAESGYLPLKGTKDQLIDRLIRSLGEPDPLVQVLLLDVVYDSLKIRAISAALNPSTLPTTEIKRTSTQDVTQNQTTPSTVDRDQQPSSRVPPPPQLLIKALQEGWYCSARIDTYLFD
ncbi:hypothetical protein M7I_0267 [Glarea lozoyensis 74030]|uniref:Uncharacterized protein n=1 Tax=Glarea lozoyensis (strain ATCC 74030 / MF5533) TaxID=1104152 RepID=H0ECX1_GLAL7|nr:hypothetical protein M7I_0267 [Glarea lozoyensis 74030]